MTKSVAVVGATLGLMAVARICHEVNRAYCLSLGDESQKPWDDAADWQRASACNGVTLHLENPDAGPAASHESWMAEKVAAGWVYGEVKDETKKTHPCIVPYDQLPPEQQLKDKLFIAVVHAAAAGLLPEIAASASAAGTLQDELALVRKDMAALEVEKVALAGERDGLKDTVAKLRKEANVSKKAKPAKVRAAGPLKDGNADGATMLELLNSEPHEIVFSDGKKEIAALAPLRVGGKSWAKGPSGVVMTEPVKIRPDRAVTLAGFALFDEKGEQLGWCAMPRPMQVGPGQEVKLDRQIVF